MGYKKDKILTNKTSLLDIKDYSDLNLIKTILSSNDHTNKDLSLKSLNQLSLTILKKIDKINIQNIRLKDLIGIKNITKTQAYQIIASIEFTKRILSTNTKIKKPADVYNHLKHFSSRDKEHFITISLSSSFEIKNTHIVSIGTINSTQVHPREVFVNSIKDKSTSIILAHNHPSGCLDPSSEDLIITKKLVAVGELIGIPVVDHIIFSKKTFYSFSDNSLI